MRKLVSALVGAVFLAWSIAVDAGTPPRADIGLRSTLFVVSGPQAGSAILISYDYALTAAHVVKGSTGVIVAGASAPDVFQTAEVVYRDDKRDVVVLHLSAPVPGLTPVSLCSTFSQIGVAVTAYRAIQMEEPRVTIGKLVGLAPMLPTGSGTDTSIVYATHTADLYPGFSGGPLLDYARGCVVGMNVSVVSDGVTQDAAYAVPQFVLREAIERATKEQRG